MQNNNQGLIHEFLVGAGAPGKITSLVVGITIIDYFSYRFISNLENNYNMQIEWMIIKSSPAFFLA